jgi:hypothetical protein
LGLVDGDRKLDGQIRHTDCEIKLEATLRGQVYWQTIIHEALHAMLIQTGQEMEESGIDPLAYQMYGFIMDNKGLIRKMMEDK